MNPRKPHPHVPHHQYAPGKLIELYEDELAVLVTEHLRKNQELEKDEKATFYRAGVNVYPDNSVTPGKKEKYFHFRVYCP